MMKKLGLLGILIFSIILVFIRFYNLPATTRFTRDESSNLVDMHRIWKEKKITLVGPVDVSNTVIYPSLTFYMLMPFAVIGNFSPPSPAYGTAFFGVLSAVLLTLIAYKVNKKYTLLVGLLVLVWYPLIESSRWAWNPHLVPFTSAIAMLVWLKKGKFNRFASGVFFGLSFHLHYFSIVSFGVFAALSGLSEIIKRRFKEAMFFGLGFITMLVPFVIFDLRNPPGLFFGRFLTNNLVSENLPAKLAGFGQSLIDNTAKSLFYITQNNILASLAGILIVLILLIDIKKYRSNLMYFLPVAVQVAAISFLPYYAGRYFLLSITFFVMWIISPREGISSLASKLLVIIMIIGSVFSIPKLLTESQIPPGGYVVGKVSKYINSEIDAKGLKNVNLAVLGSADPDPLGVTYRHTLLVMEERILSESEYTVTDNLFIITQGGEEDLRGDNSNVMNGFRSGKAELRYRLNGTGWKVYLFNRDKK